MFRLISPRSLISALIRKPISFLFIYTQKLYIYPIVYYSYLVTRAFYDSARIRDPRNQSLRINPKETRLKLDSRSDSSNSDCPYPPLPYVRARCRALSTGAASYNNNLRANIAASWIQSSHSQSRQFDIYIKYKPCCLPGNLAISERTTRSNSSCLSCNCRADLH